MWDLLEFVLELIIDIVRGRSKTGCFVTITAVALFTLVIWLITR